MQDQIYDENGTKLVCPEFYWFANQDYALSLTCLPQYSFIVCNFDIVMNISEQQHDE